MEKREREIMGSWSIKRGVGVIWLFERVKNGWGKGGIPVPHLFPSVTMKKIRGQGWGQSEGRGWVAHLLHVKPWKSSKRDSLVMLGEHWLYPTNSSAAVSHASGLSTVPVIGRVSVGGAEEGGATKIICDLCFSLLRHWAATVSSLFTMRVIISEKRPTQISQRIIERPKSSIERFPEACGGCCLCKLRPNQSIYGVIYYI